MNGNRGYTVDATGYDPKLSQNLAFDPDRARALLREAGYGNGKTPTLTLSSPSGRDVKDREIAEAVAGYLEDVGFKVKLEVLDWSIYNNRLFSDGFGELYLWGMGSYTDASSLFSDDFKRHYAWSDPEFVALTERVTTARTDAERIAISQRGQQIIADQRMRIGLLYPQSIYGVSDRVIYDGRYDEMIPAEVVTRR